ncbi:MAG: hypothetical protein M3320_02120, partial [Actinomycetota bacterium]|nr:hypothetical protein [Actinomycetota bacterium]
MGGTLGVHEEERTLAPRWSGPLIEVRMRTRGDRLHVAGRQYTWRADRTAVQRVVDVALDWCVRDASAAWLMIGVNPDVAMAPEEVAGRVREALRDTVLLEVRSADRAVVVEQLEGRIALTDAGSPWRRRIGPMTDVLRNAAPDLVYGFARSGWSATYVMQGESLRFEWPPRPDLDPDRVGLGFAFEDEYVPDAFAIQLLGPGYAGRIPATSLYTASSVGDATLLGHVDLGA